MAVKMVFGASCDCELFSAITKTYN